MDSEVNTTDFGKPVPEQNSPQKSKPAILPFIAGTVVGAVLTYLLASPSLAGRGTVTDAAALRESALAGAREGARKGVEEALAAESTRTAQELSQAEIDPAASPAQTTAGSIGPQRPTAGANVAGANPAAQPYPLRTANLQGPTAAPITIIEYGDFGCVFCSKFHKDTFQQVIDNYVKTGKAKFMFKQMPIVQLHPGADIAALGSECAADQDQFWPYHELVFAQGQSSFTIEQVKALTQQLKLDMPKWEACMNKQDGAAAQRMQVDMNEAGEVGVRGTPTFLINGRLLVGAQPYAAFQRVLDAALAQNK